MSIQSPPYHNSTLDQLSLAMLSSLTTPSVIVSVGSGLGVLTNTLVILTIARSKKLHNKSQLMILSLSIPEALFSLIALLVNARTSWYAWTRTPDVARKCDCVWWILPWSVISQVSMYFILLLGVDRLISVGDPVFYKRLPPFKYIVGANSLCWTIMFAQVAFALVRNDLTGVIPLCTYVLLFDQSFMKFQSVESYVMSVLIAIVYFSAIVIVALRYWSRRGRWTDPADRDSWARRLKLSAFKAMMTVGILYLMFHGLAIGGSHFAVWFLSPEVAALVAPYISILFNINSGSHLLVYLALGSIFRECFVELFRVKKFSTVGVAYSGGPQS